MLATRSLMQQNPVLNISFTEIRMSLHRFASIALTAISTSLLAQNPEPQKLMGFRDSTAQIAIDKKFNAVPDPKLAEEHLRILTAEPHMAGTIEDKKTADYVAKKFRDAGLETEIVEYKVWINYPKESSVTVTAPTSVKMVGPAPEHVSSDPYQNDPRIVPSFNGSSADADIEAEVIYANYGTPADFKKLKELGIDVRGKIVITRYGSNFRGVKVYDAEENGAAAVIIYSDPQDDGYFKGDVYPKGPWRPDSAVQRGSVQYMFKYPGDPLTPGTASLPSLAKDKILKPDQAMDLPKIACIPLSYADAKPILENLAGPLTPREWQGALPFAYHTGPGLVKVKMHIRNDYQYRTIWDVIGKIKGSELPQEWVVAGNHRDAWVYGAVDPNSGTASMLEMVHGLGELLKTGWKPKRTIVIGSWDAEEEGLMGSTEWVEDHEKELANAAAYFNVDVSVSGPNFGASGVPSLKPFLKEVTQSVPSFKGRTVYELWKNSRNRRRSDASSFNAGQTTAPAAAGENDDVSVGDLGSGSDYTPFFQHSGVPSSDIGSNGDYGVYHSVFDNFNWYKKFGDPDFTINTQMARVLGIEVLHMADVDILPFDNKGYGDAIQSYLKSAKQRAEKLWGTKSPKFDAAIAAAVRFTTAGEKIAAAQAAMPADANKLNKVLRDSERALLANEGLPKRPWFRHTVFAPGEYTGYAAVVIPGVNEAIDASDIARMEKQLAVLTAALERSCKVMEDYK